ncbi:CDP-glucose 4,6-dehydratase [Clostridia bacterium]|nr:CDP-glucose 4,6-dehydratase [Clostridia bacterium]
MFDLSVYQGKKVWVTGHNGFKGSWLCKVLALAGARVCGYSLALPDTKNLFSLMDLSDSVVSIIGDVRDRKTLEKEFTAFAPEYVFHLAAQPLVKFSYQEPAYTYETNVMGTVNLLDCARRSSSVRSILNVTTDKVYENKEWEWGYRENEPLNGYDPYSNSKSCSELITSTYQRCFFEGKVAISTARAGNVIGGGDFALDRIIPDCIRAALEKKEIFLRNPHSIRPYQHVLEPIFAYLYIAWKQSEEMKFAGTYNIGPEQSDCISTKELAEKFCKTWGENLTYLIEKENQEAVHEASFLTLDCAKIKKVLKWKPIWNIDTAIQKTVEWVKSYQAKENIEICMEKQIFSYLESI